MPVLAVVAACGGGGGGGSAPAPVPPAPNAAVLSVSNPVASQAAAGQSQLVFRTTLLVAPVFPASMSYSITGAVGGARCDAGIDFVLVPTANLSVAAAGATTSGVLALSSAASERLITAQVCPGSGATDKALALHWSDGVSGGDVVGTVRATAIVAINKSKRLNDTGITACANGSTNTAACQLAGFPGQDAESGRDVSVAITGLGANRISAFALSTLPSGACVQDNVTGLVWEGKTTSGLHAAASTYSWLASSGANGGAAGSAGAGVCTGSACDTEHFVAAVNTEALCGFTDWRLPTADELGGIVDAGTTVAPTIPAQFANQAAAPYWSASPKAGDTAGAWALDFNSGAIGALAKSSANRVRLVRGH